MAGTDAAQATTETAKPTGTITGDVKVTPVAAAAATTTETAPASIPDPAAEAAAKATADAAAKATADAETKRKADEAAASSKAPEKYALVLPTGSEQWLDASDIAQVERAARDAGMTQEAAQEALDKHADRMAEQSATFRAQVEADPVYGGDHLNETATNAQRFLSQIRPVGTPRGDAIRRLLAKTGFGNNIEVVSLFADAGKLMAEDAPIGGRTTTGTVSDPASKLYPDSK
jgi:hypothetical protein